MTPQSLSSPPTEPCCTLTLPALSPAQLYQLHVAVVIDTVGQRAQLLTTRGSLRIMEFVRKYMVGVHCVLIQTGLLGFE